MTDLDPGSLPIFVSALASVLNKTCLIQEEILLLLAKLCDSDQQ